MKYAVVIPARYQSSRFPGKPLVKICGKYMIQHVWERCIAAVDKEKVFVATDDDRIVKVVEEFGGKTILTNSDCLTGTDRLAEANEVLDCDFLINVQGDEPVIDPNHIQVIIDRYIQTGNITNAMCKVETEQEFRSFTVPKVVTSSTGRLLYMSRSGIPVSKDNVFSTAFKQVCIYAFGREHLKFFAAKPMKTNLENIEDIEILRFLESDYDVEMVEVSNGSVAVDIPSDVKLVEQILNQ